MRTVEEIRLAKLKELVEEAGSAAALNRRAKRNERDSTISQILNRWTGTSGKPKELGSAMARELEQAMGKPRGWMDNDDLSPLNVASTEGPGSTILEDLKGYRVKAVMSEEQTTSEVGRIPYWEARGSCGGGFLNYEQMPAGHLVKEASFFKRFNLNPANAIAVYADGDSMSDFIVDGDIVIFDTSKTEPRSGKIFLIDHPEGLRIKQLRRDIDGSWVLESRNVDKRRFPDERLMPSQAGHLKIHGEFVYRQGGA